jgi:hypothetical protein
MDLSRFNEPPIATCPCVYDPIALEDLFDAGVFLAEANADGEIIGTAGTELGKLASDAARECPGVLLRLFFPLEINLYGRGGVGPRLEYRDPLFE